MHKCILAEFVHTQRVKSDALMLDQFASTCSKKLFGSGPKQSGRMWNDAALGQPSFQTDNHFFLECVRKLCGSGNVDHKELAAAARDAGLALAREHLGVWQTVDPRVSLLVLLIPGRARIEDAGVIGSERARALKLRKAAKQREKAERDQSRKGPVGRGPHAGLCEQMPREGTPTATATPAAATATTTSPGNSGRSHEAYRPQAREGKRNSILAPFSPSKMGNGVPRGRSGGCAKGADARRAQCLRLACDRRSWQPATWAHSSFSAGTV